MKNSLASATPKTWNRKNLPSEIERYEQGSGGTIRTIRKLPSAAAAVARRQPAIVTASLVAVGILGVFWYLASRD